MAPRVVRWISEHDDNWPFFFLYIALSIVLSVYFNLGFFLVLILIHFLLDFVKHWHSNNRKTNHTKYALLYAFRDGFLLDFFLLVVAFAFGYIFHFTFAVSISNGVRLLRLVELEDFLRVLSRLVVADWVITHISWLALYVREIDMRRIYMPPRLQRHEILMLVGILLIVGCTLLLPALSFSDYGTLKEYALKEMTLIR